MIYSELTNKALKIAYEAHCGQTDKCGIPYIFHPFHLAEQMTDEYSVCAALLHDVVEDTAVTIDELADIFPCEVIEALKLLTHDPETDYFDYVRAIKGNAIATAVKLADLKHNSDETRFGGVDVDESSAAYRREKYSKAYKILNGTT